MPLGGAATYFMWGETCRYFALFRVHHRGDGNVGRYDHFGKNCVVDGFEGFTSKRSSAGFSPSRRY